MKILGRYKDMKRRGNVRLVPLKFNMVQVRISKFDEFTGEQIADEYHDIDTAQLQAMREQTAAEMEEKRVMLEEIDALIADAASSR